MDVLIFKPCHERIREIYVSSLKKKIDSVTKNIFVTKKYYIWDETYIIDKGGQNEFVVNECRFHKITTKQELHKLLEKGYTLYDKEKNISDIEKLLSE